MCCSRSLFCSSSWWTRACASSRAVASAFSWSLRRWTCRRWWGQRTDVDTAARLWADRSGIITSMREFASCFGIWAFSPLSTVVALTSRWEGRGYLFPPSYTLWRQQRHHYTFTCGNNGQHKCQRVDGIPSYSRHLVGPQATKWRTDSQRIWSPRRPRTTRYFHARCLCKFSIIQVIFMQCRMSLCFIGLTLSRDKRQFCVAYMLKLKYTFIVEAVKYAQIIQDSLRVMQAYFDKSLQLLWFYRFY